MNIVICDDSAKDLSDVKAYINEFQNQYGLQFGIDCCANAEELITAVKNGKKYDLAFLDIYMGDTNGITTAHRLKELLPEIEAAFFTSSAEHAVDAFDFNALHYIIKPVSYDKILETFERFYKRLHTSMKALEIVAENKTYSFPLIHIQKLQSANKGVDVYLNNKSVPEHIPLAFSRVEEQLSPKLFLKISRGLIVQMSFILCVDKDICRFKDGTEAVVSRKNRDEIRRKYNDYLFT